MDATLQELVRDSVKFENDTERRQKKLLKTKKM